MEMKIEELENATIGEDKPGIEAAPVKVVDYVIEDVQKDGKNIGKKLTLHVEHPKVNDRKIEISSVKYLKNKEINSSGMWVKADDDGHLAYQTALAYMLRFFKLDTISDVKGKEMPTEVDDKGYLTIKAY